MILGLLKVDMKRFEVFDLPLNGLKLIESKPIIDARGYFERLFCVAELSACGWDKAPPQLNLSYSAQSGVIRGMHYQKAPHAEMKMVRCLKGRIFDVAVDIRPKSETFLSWYGVELSDENNHSLLIPEGFAHGFQVLSDGAQLFYAHSHIYVPQAQKGLNPLDPALGIKWPQIITFMSDKDASAPLIDFNQREGWSNEL